MEFSPIIFIGFFIYVIPALVAGLRHHHQGWAITALNLLLGWTLLGWIAALVWALTATRPEPAATQPIAPSEF